MNKRRSPKGNLYQLIQQMEHPFLPPREESSSPYRVQQISTIGMLFADVVYERDGSESVERFIRELKERLMREGRGLYRRSKTENSIREECQGDYASNPFEEGTMEHIVVDLAAHRRFTEIGETIKEGAEQFKEWNAHVNVRRVSFGQKQIDHTPAREYHFLAEAFTAKYLKVE